MIKETYLKHIRRKKEELPSGQPLDKLAILRATAEEILEKADDNVKQEVQDYLNDEGVNDDDDNGGVDFSTEPTAVTNIDASDPHNAKAMEYLRSVISTHFYFAPY